VGILDAIVQISTNAAPIVITQGLHRGAVGGRAIRHDLIGLIACRFSRYIGTLEKFVK
jgi:hypothetical protein